MPTFNPTPLKIVTKDGTEITAEQIARPKRNGGSRLFEPGRYIAIITSGKWATFGSTKDQRKWGKVTFDLIVKNATPDGDVNLLRQDYILGEVDANDQFVDLDAASGFHYLRAALGLADKPFDTDKLSGRALSAVIRVAGYRTGKTFKGDIQPKELAALIGVGQYATLDQIEESTRFYNIRNGFLVGDEVAGFEEVNPDSVVRLKMKMNMLGVIDSDWAGANGLYDAGNGEYFMNEAAFKALNATSAPQNRRPGNTPRSRL